MTNEKETVTNGLPEFKVVGETDLPGYFYLSFVRTRDLIRMDGKGNVVWSKHEEPVPEKKFAGLWDFKKHVVEGKTYYSYHDVTGAYDNYDVGGYGPGERVILDEDFNEIRRITFEQSSVVEKGHPLDGHDFLMFDLDHYILSGYIRGTVNNIPDVKKESTVVYSYLQEVKNGEVVWEFRSIDYPELYGIITTDGSETAADLTNEKTEVPDIIHFNSMCPDDDGNLVCSFRHIDSILCLDRSRSEDQILWKLSGAGDEFGLTEEQKTSCQHYAMVEGDTITVFDNGNRTGVTRLCAYTLDTKAKQLKSFRAYEYGEKYSPACGDACRLSGDMFAVGWGKTDKDYVCMSVIDYSSGKELMKVELSGPDDFTYRCVYCE